MGGMVYMLTYYIREPIVSNNPIGVNTRQDTQMWDMITDGLVFRKSLEVITTISRENGFSFHFK